MRSKFFIIVGLYLSSLLLPVGSNAVVIGACDIDLPGLCTKSVDINVAGTQFTLVLSNTSPPANGGFITADAFDLPGALGATLFSSTNANFNFIAGAINVSPFTPDREFLLTTDASPDANNSFEGGGSPNGGIPSGGSATFVFNFTGGTLTDNQANETAIFTSEAVRFRGFNDGGSDKDLTFITTNGGPSTSIPVPEPSTLILFGAGIITLAALVRRKILHS